MSVEIEHIVTGWPVSEDVRDQMRRSGNGAVPPIVAGSIKSPCVECGMLIWVGPRQQQMMIERRDVHPHCPWCSAAVMASDPEHTIVTSVTLDQVPLDQQGAFVDEVINKLLHRDEGSS